MLKMIFVVEDITISATRGDTKWEVDLVENHNGERGKVELTDTEFGCMLALTAGAGEELRLSEATIFDLYSVIEPFFTSIRKLPRPFP